MWSEPGVITVCKPGRERSWEEGPMALLEPSRMSQDLCKVRRWAWELACTNLPDSQGLVPFKVISPEHSKTGRLRRAQSNLMDDLTMENWGKKNMIHARYQPCEAKRVMPAIHSPSGMCLFESAHGVGQIQSEPLGWRNVHLSSNLLADFRQPVHLSLVRHTSFRTCFIPGGWDYVGVKESPFLPVFIDNVSVCSLLLFTLTKIALIPHR